VEKVTTACADFVGTFRPQGSEIVCGHAVRVVRSPADIVPGSTRPCAYIRAQGWNARDSVELAPRIFSAPRRPSASCCESPSPLRSDPYRHSRLTASTPGRRPFCLAAAARRANINGGLWRGLCTQLKNFPSRACRSKDHVQPHQRGEADWRPGKAHATAPRALVPGY
jgi:hypothetical protein